MNSHQRFEAQRTGKRPDRPSNFSIFMTFGARLIGQPLGKYYTDYRVLCEANYALVERYQVDIVQAISDPYREASDFGARVHFPPDGLPVCKEPLLKSERDLLHLVVPDPTAGERMSDRLAAIAEFRGSVGGVIPIMGWVEGALAEAATLRGVQQLLIDLVKRPLWVHDLLEHCTQVAIAFAREQVEAGADLVGLGDAIASQVSPRMFREFALPYERRIFEAVRQAGAVPRLHICGDIRHLLRDIGDSGAEIVDLDWMVGIPTAVETLPERILLCGNVDPVGVMLKGSPDGVYDETVRCLREGGKRLIVGAGCEIPARTPAENLDAQMRAVREFGETLRVSE